MKFEIAGLFIFGLLACASSASVPEYARQDAPEGSPPPEGGRVIEQSEFATTCASPDEWQGVDPNTIDGIYSCFSRTLHKDRSATIYISGVINHNTGGDTDNPNDLCTLPIEINLPVPVKTRNNTQVPQLGPIAIGVNGVFFYGPTEGNGANAVRGSGGMSVACEGHASPDSVWHYHHPDFACTDPDANTLVGYAFDGFPIYGPLPGTKAEVDNVLDDCNGRDYPRDRLYRYRYHIRNREQVDETLESNVGENNTDNWKYFLGCYRGANIISGGDFVASTTKCANEEGSTIEVAGRIEDNSSGSGRMPRRRA